MSWLDEPVTCLMNGNRQVWSIGRIITDMGKLKYFEKTCPIATSSITDPILLICHMLSYSKGWHVEIQHTHGVDSDEP